MFLPRDPSNPTNALKQRELCMASLGGKVAVIRALRTLLTDAAGYMLFLRWWSTLCLNSEIMCDGGRDRTNWHESGLIRCDQL